MSMTDSSSRSRRSPGPPKNSMPKPSCSRSNQAPPMPSTARPPEMLSSVVASLAVSPGFRNVFAPTIKPSRTREVTAPSPARTLQPSKIGCSHGPKMAIRWSHVQIESQPAASAARAASRKPGQSVRCDQSCSPKRVIGTTSLLELIVDGGRSEPERDALLTLEPVADQPLGLVGIVRVVAAGHLGDVGLGRRLVGRHTDGAGQPDPAVAIHPVVDRQRDPRVSHEVRRPASTLGAVDDDLIAVDPIPDRRLTGRSIGVERGDGREAEVVEEVANVVWKRAGHALDGTRARRPATSMAGLAAPPPRAARARVVVKPPSRTSTRRGGSGSAAGRPRR